MIPLQPCFLFSVMPEAHGEAIIGLVGMLRRFPENPLARAEQCLPWLPHSQE